MEKSAVCPYGQDGQWYLQIHLKVYGKLVKRGFSLTLLYSTEPMSEVLCPVLGSLGQKETRNY